MTDEIHNISHPIMQNLNSEIDAYLLAFFGSLENAKEFGRLYVLEQTIPKFKSEAEGMNIKLSLTSEYRLRLKTEEELYADSETLNEGHNK